MIQNETFSFEHSVHYLYIHTWRFSIYSKMDQIKIKNTSYFPRICDVYY